MPSAAEKVAMSGVERVVEKVTDKLPEGEPKPAENTLKENADPNEKSVPAIQQVISIISNKVRNLEKRKVSVRMP